MKLNHPETHVSADYLIQIYLMINFPISYNIYLFIYFYCIGEKRICRGLSATIERVGEAMQTV